MKGPSPPQEPPLYPPMYPPLPPQCFPFGVQLLPSSWGPCSALESVVSRFLSSVSSTGRGQHTLTWALQLQPRRHLYHHHHHKGPLSPLGETCGYPRERRQAGGAPPEHPGPLFPEAAKAPEGCALVGLGGGEPAEGPGPQARPGSARLMSWDSGHVSSSCPECGGCFAPVLSARPPAVPGTDLASVPRDSALILTLYPLPCPSNSARQIPSEVRPSLSASSHFLNPPSLPGKPLKCVITLPFSLLVLLNLFFRTALRP